MKKFLTLLCITLFLLISGCRGADDPFTTSNLVSKKIQKEDFDTIMKESSDFLKSVFGNQIDIINISYMGDAASLHASKQLPKELQKDKKILNSILVKVQFINETEESWYLFFEQDEKEKWDVNMTGCGPSNEYFNIPDNLEGLPKESN